MSLGNVAHLFEEWTYQKNMWGTLIIEYGGKKMIIGKKKENKIKQLMITKNPSLHNHELSATIW